MSNSEETSRRSAGKRNSNFDGDVSNKRNSGWKNLSCNLRRNSSQLHPESPKVLNASNSAEEIEQNSQWCKNFTVNKLVSSPIKLKSIPEKGNRSSTNLLEKKLSQDESENENVSENIFPNKQQEQPSQKNRYSRTFNLNTERQIEKESQKQTKTEIVEFINKTEENKITQSPTSKLIKANKEKRRTKSTFSNRPIKRKYDDVFIEPNEIQDKETNKNQLILQDDPKDDMAEKLEKKEKLFKLNIEKEKYSFFDEPVANNTQVKDCSKVTSFKTKKYSEAFALSKNKLSQNSQLDEEINIEETPNRKESVVQMETSMQLSFDSNNHQKLSSKFTIDRISDSRAISGIITINSSISTARSNQTYQNTKNITNNARFEENHTKNSRESNIDPVSKKWKIIKDKSLPFYNEKEDFERYKLLINAANNIGSKQKKSLPRAPDKKITDFFFKLGKDEKLKPIPKKVKKTLRPVCTARLIDGKPYYSKKLFHGERWCSKKFYKHIQNKIRKQSGDDTINESENIMRYIVSSVKAVIKSKKYLKKEVDDLKKELARHGIVSTTYDFFCFCFDYLPAEYRNLVVPRTVCGGVTVSFNEEDTFKKIDF